MRSRSIYMILLIICFSCNQPIERNFNPETMDADLDALLSTRTLDSAEIVQLRLYLSMKNTHDSILRKTTYKELWQATISFQQTRKEQTANELTENKEERVSIKLIAKSFKQINNQAFLICRFSAHNNTDKHIKAFKGNVKFLDIFDEEIRNIPLSCHQLIEAGKSGSFEIKIIYNSFLNRDLKLKETKPEDLTLVWIPLKIIFTDNSTL